MSTGRVVRMRVQAVAPGPGRREAELPGRKVCSVRVRTPNGTRAVDPPGHPAARAARSVRCENHAAPADACATSRTLPAAAVVPAA